MGAGAGEERERGLLDSGQEACLEGTNSGPWKHLELRTPPTMAQGRYLWEGRHQAAHWCPAQK